MEAPESLELRVLPIIPKRKQQSKEADMFWARVLQGRRHARMPTNTHEYPRIPPEESHEYPVNSPLEHHRFSLEWPVFQSSKVQKTVVPVLFQFEEKLAPV